MTIISLKQFIKENKLARNLYKLLTNRKGYITIKGKNNIFSNQSLSLRGTNIKVEGNNNTIIIESGVVLNNVKISITGNNHKLILQKNVRFNNNGGIRIEDENNSLNIGCNTTIYSAFFALGDKNTSINIGKECLFSVNIILRTYDSHSIIDLTSHKRINQGKNIVIEEHVWIGNGVNILKGVTIKKDSIIGTQSIVTHNIPNNVVACGIPARVVKENVTWDESRIFN